MATKETALLAELNTWVRRNPQVWPDPGDERISNERMAELGEEIVAHAKATSMPKRPWPRIRRIVAGICIAIALGGGVAAASGLFGPGQPTRVEEGVMCRSDASLLADGVGVGNYNDPIEACETMWAEGWFKPLVRPHDELVACIGPRGATEVFPGEPDLCSQLGLEVAAAELSPANQAIVALKARLNGEINDQECMSVQETAELAEAILVDEGMDDWQVEIAAGHQRGRCGWVVMDSTEAKIVAARK